MILRSSWEEGAKSQGIPELWLPHLPWFVEDIGDLRALQVVLTWLHSCFYEGSLQTYEGPLELESYLHDTSHGSGADTLLPTPEIALDLGLQENPESMSY